ncbi:MAG: VRR-NUC domain-containing protein [Bacillota bacterium]|nr:VRR-NUC domain-containing protein [Bacillota bacterium]
MRENIIEEYLRNKVKAIGGKAYKFVSPGNSGVPDRLVLLPGGRSIFVELKAPNNTPTAKQLLQHKKLRALGFTVLVIDSKEKVDEFIKHLGEVMPHEVHTP